MQDLLQLHRVHVDLLERAPGLKFSAESVAHSYPNQEMIVPHQIEQMFKYP